MQEFVQLWVYLSTTPLFGLTATIVTYVLAHTLYLRLGQAPWANPVLWTVLVLAVLLRLSGTPYPTSFSGAQFLFRPFINDDIGIDSSSHRKHDTRDTRQCQYSA